MFNCLFVPECHDELMPEDDYEDLKYDVDRHQTDLHKLSKRITAPRSDLEVIVALDQTIVDRAGNAAYQPTPRPCSGPTRRLICRCKKSCRNKHLTAYKGLELGLRRLVIQIVQRVAVSAALTRDCFPSNS
jgi:hypothetical protein